MARFRLSSSVGTGSAVAAWNPRPCSNGRQGRLCRHDAGPMLLRDVTDEQDWVLLRLLRYNAHASTAELAIAAGLAPSSVHQRIRRLERRGVIRRWTIDLDP